MAGDVVPIAIGMCSETRPNAKPENVMCQATKDLQTIN
jgi:hypothetical protein